MSLSGSFAYELGKTYQMGKNCKKELRNIASSKAEGLFFRYMTESEVHHTMLNYERGVKSKAGIACDRKEFKASIPAINTRIDSYFKIAAPFTHPHTHK